MHCFTIEVHTGYKHNDFRTDLKTLYKKVRPPLSFPIAGAFWRQLLFMEERVLPGSGEVYNKAAEKCIKFVLIA